MYSTTFEYSQETGKYLWSVCRYDLSQLIILAKEFHFNRVWVASSIKRPNIVLSFNQNDGTNCLIKIIKIESDRFNRLI